MRKIQELGPLPPASELSRYSAMSIDSLINELESVNKKLKMYSHVNKKAFDQFVNFSEQRDSLLARKAELDRGAEKVQELLESLDRQKDEAINRTFRGVSAHFRDVFKEIVPTGSGELIMKTKLDHRVIEDGSSDDEHSSSEVISLPNRERIIPSIDTYEGIGIKVSFSSVGENYMMSQLSGGQKVRKTAK
jgi:structural maintenance of chromosome 3 (chondroitin sulfate proteoglycan 6)